MKIGLTILKHTAILFAMYILLWTLFCCLLAVPILGWILDVFIGQIVLNFQYIAIVYILIAIGIEKKRYQSVKNNSAQPFKPHAGYL